MTTKRSSHVYGFHQFSEQLKQTVSTIWKKKTWSIFGNIEDVRTIPKIQDIVQSQNVPPSGKSSTLSTGSILGSNDASVQFDIMTFISSRFFLHANKQSLEYTKPLGSLQSEDILLPGITWTKMADDLIIFTDKNRPGTPTDSLNEYMSRIITAESGSRNNITLMRVQDLYAVGLSGTSGTKKEVSQQPIGYWLNIIIFNPNDAFPTKETDKKYKAPFPQVFVFIRAQNAHVFKGKKEYNIEWESLSIYKQPMASFYSGEDIAPDRWKDIKPEIDQTRLPIKDTILTVDFLQVQNLVPISRMEAGGFTIVAKKPVYLFTKNTYKVSEREASTKKQPQFRRNLESLKLWENYLEEVIKEDDDDDGDDTGKSNINIVLAENIFPPKTTTLPSSSSSSATSLNIKKEKATPMKRSSSIGSSTWDDVKRIISSDDGCRMVTPLGSFMSYLIREALVVEDDQKYDKKTSFVARFILQCIFLGLDTFPIVCLQHLVVFSEQAKYPVKPSVWYAKEFPKEYQNNTKKDLSVILEKLGYFSQSPIFEDIETSFFDIHASEVLKFKYFAQKDILSMAVQSVAYIYNNFHNRNGPDGLGVQKNMSELQNFLDQLTTDYSDTVPRRHYLTENQYQQYLEVIKPEKVVLLSPLRYLLSCPWARIRSNNKKEGKCHPELAKVVGKIEYRPWVASFQDFFIQNISSQDDVVQNLYKCIFDYNETGLPAVDSSVMSGDEFNQMLTSSKIAVGKLQIDYDKKLLETKFGSPKHSKDPILMDVADVYLDNRTLPVLGHIVDHLEDTLNKKLTSQKSSSGLFTKDEISRILKYLEIIRNHAQFLVLTKEELDYLQALNVSLHDTELPLDIFITKPDDIAESSDDEGEDPRKRRFALVPSKKGGEEVSKSKPKKQRSIFMEEEEEQKQPKKSSGAPIVQYPPKKPILSTPTPKEKTTHTSVFLPTEYMIRENRLVSQNASKLTTNEKKLLQERNIFSGLNFSPNISKSLFDSLRDSAILSRIPRVSPAILDLRLGEYGHDSIQTIVDDIVKSSPSREALSSELSYLYTTARRVQQFIL
jgi:hypothetical protein